MKNQNNILFVIALAASLSLVSSVNAQYRPTGDDGVTASPKVRQQLNEREAGTRMASAVPPVIVIYQNPAESIAVSPKGREMAVQQRVVVSSVPSAEAASIGYQPTGTDGITASPKLREQLNEQRTPIIIAPLK